MSSSKAPNRLAVISAFAAVYFIWGSTFLGMRIAVQSIPPLMLAGLRFGLAGVILYLFSRATGAPRPSAVQWRSTSIAAGALILCGNGGTAFAMKYIPSSLGALLAATIPMFITLFSWWGGYTARPPLSVCLGLVLGFSGVVLLLRPGGAGLGENACMGFTSMIFASLIWSIGSLLIKQMKPEHLPKSLGLLGGMQMVSGGAMLIFASAVVGEWNGFDPSAVTAKALGALLYLLAFGSLVAYTSYVWLLRVCDASKVGTYAFVNPVVAVILGWGFAGEIVTTQTLFAAAMVVIGAAIIISRQPKKAVPVENELVPVE